MFDVCVRSLFPVILALGAGAILLLALGRNPVSFYQDIWLGGVSGGAGTHGRTARSGWRRCS